MMFRINNSLYLVAFLAVGLLASTAETAQAQLFGNNQQTTNNAANSGSTVTNGTNSGTAQTTAAGGAGQTAASEFSLDRPEITTDIDQLTQQMQSTFVGTSNESTEFAGVAGAGQNVNAQNTRQFNTRTQSRNINQSTQRQPLYRTFGSNNVPYRAPHRIAFQFTRPPRRSVDLTLGRNVRILSSRRPQFENVQFVMSGNNTVTLRGTVASDDDLKTAMLYVKMEPGVDRVINELQVSAAGPGPLTPPAPPTASGQ